MANVTTDDGRRRGQAVPLSTDDHLRLLASERRRALLDVLTDEHVPVDVADLAAAVADRAGACDVDAVALTLHHTHLPLLDDLDVVEYDYRDGRVTAYKIQFVRQLTA